MSTARCPGCGVRVTMGDPSATLCWMDASRECSSSCVAWDRRALAENGLSTCIHINIGRSVARNLAGILSSLQQPPLPAPPVVR